MTVLPLEAPPTDVQRIHISRRGKILPENLTDHMTGLMEHWRRQHTAANSLLLHSMLIKCFGVGVNLTLMDQYSD